MVTNNKYDMNDFILREHVAGSLSNRNQIMENSSINIYNYNQEHYRSLYLFNSDINRYINTNTNDKGKPSLSGFSGPHFIDEIIFDFDGQNLEDVLAEVRSFSIHLTEKYKVSSNNISIAFSGNKGFHIGVSTTSIRFIEPSENLNEIIRLMATEIASGFKFFDPVIYKITGLIRIPNSQNQKSGFYKTPLTFDELFSLDIDQIKNLATSPRLSFKKNEPEILENDSLTNLYLNCKNLIERSVEIINNTEKDDKRQFINDDQISDVIKYLKGKIDNYDDWLKCGFALASLTVNNSEKEQLVINHFLDLSLENPHYPSDSEKIIKEHIERFIRYYNDQKGNPIRINTLFHIAKKYGYNQNILASSPNIAQEVNDEIRFDINCLHDSKFKELLKYNDSRSSSPIEYLLTGQLAAISGTIGKRAYFKINEYQNIYLNVYAVVIGPSSTMKKTSALNLVTVEMHRIAELGNDTDPFTNTSVGFEINKDSKLRSNVNIILPNDCTVESLGDILADTDNGLMIHSEFGALLAQLNRGYSGDSKQFLTNIYDVPPIYKITRVTKGIKTLINPCFSILGASTIEWIRSNSSFNDIYSGFFARFLYSIRNKNDKRPIPLFELGKRDDSNMFDVNPKELYEDLAILENNTEIQITEDSKSTYGQYEEKINTEISKYAHSAEGSFIQRLLIYTVKFAGIIALADRRTKVNNNDMEDAIHISEYFRKNITTLLGSELNQTEFSLKEKRIYELIKMHQSKISRSEILNSFKIKAKELDEVIANLIEKELIVEKRDHSPNTYKPTTYYSLIKNSGDKLDK